MKSNTPLNIVAHHAAHVGYHPVGEVVLAAALHLNDKVLLLLISTINIKDHVLLDGQRAQLLRRQVGQVYLLGSVFQTAIGWSTLSPGTSSLVAKILPSRQFHITNSINRTEYSFVVNLIAQRAILRLPGTESLVPNHKIQLIV